MNAMVNDHRGWIPVWRRLMLALCLTASGCHWAHPHHDPTRGPVHPAHGTDQIPPVYQTMPRELAKVVLPEYIIEPPDILSIEGVHIVPKSPYKLRTLDVLTVDVLGTLPEAPIGGAYAIEPGGVINFGVPYGTVRITGLSVRDAEAAIQEHLEKFLQEPEVSVALAQLAASQNIVGQFLVGPDGTITLGSYGHVSVVGMTLAQAKAAIEAHLSSYLDQPEISLSMYAYNSKVYYIVLQGAGLGDGVYRYPITGNETVLDAIAQIQGLEQVSSKKIWIARPTRDEQRVQVLPVDWYAITEQGTPHTNYQVLPGDRVFIAEDRLVAFDTQVAKITAPLERMFGFILLGTGTVTRLSGPVLEGGGNRGNQF
jgi:polysaccharide export outer membrane protein